MKGLFNDSVETVPVHLLLTNALVRLQHDNGLPWEMGNTKTKNKKWVQQLLNVFNTESTT